MLEKLTHLPDFWNSCLVDIMIRVNPVRWISRESIIKLTQGAARHFRGDATGLPEASKDSTNSPTSNSPKESTTNGSPHQLQSAVANSQLEQLLKDDTYQSEVFKFVIANINHNLDNELLQVVIYNLLQLKNIQATTTLLHFLESKFKLSNQLWSYYVSQVIEGSNHLGAIMIYHHLIDNYEMYNDASTYSTTNPKVPFLLTPAVLELLSTIFANSKDHIRVDGVLEYFKRFYSYIAHKSSYKCLLIYSVEVYSMRGNTEKALISFKKLALSLRGHREDINWHHQNHFQNMSVSTNRVWRNKNIKDNNKGKFAPNQELKTSLDVKLETWALESGVELYNPIVEKNVYTSPNTHPLPLLSGSLKTTDLEQFQKNIILPIVKHTITSGTMDTQYLLTFILSYHFVLQIFVIRSLCELGYFSQALDLINRIYKKVPSIRSDNFVQFFYHYKNSEQTDLDLIYNAIDQHKRVNTTSPVVYAQFFSCLIAKKALTMRNTTNYLDEYTSKEKIRLGDEDLLKVQEILQDSAYLKMFIS